MYDFENVITQMSPAKSLNGNQDSAVSLVLSEMKIALQISGAQVYIVNVYTRTLRQNHRFVASRVSTNSQGKG